MRPVDEKGSPNQRSDEFSKPRTIVEVGAGLGVHGHEYFLCDLSLALAEASFAVVAEQPLLDAILDAAIRAVPNRMYPVADDHFTQSKTKRGTMWLSRRTAGRRHSLHVALAERPLSIRFAVITIALFRPKRPRSAAGAAGAQTRSRRSTPVRSSALFGSESSFPRSQLLGRRRVDH